MKQFKYGIWTPSADVICHSCHDNKLDKVTTGDLKESFGITTCDKCSCKIKVDSSVAEEHNLVIEFRKLGMTAHMEQLGGMNSACNVYCGNGYYFLIVYNWDGNDGYAVTMYDREGEPVGEGLWFITKLELFKAMEDLKTI